jgi:hypothetical protein
MKNTLSLTALLILGGCNADHSLGLIDRDSGPDLPSSDVAALTASETSGTGQVGPTSSPDAAVIGPLRPSQSWTGYLENYQFQSGSDVIRFTFATDSTGRVAGTAFLGNGTPPAPATDPNVAYPPEFIANGGFIPYWVEGFAYSMADGKLSSSRLQFTVQSYELWSGWCALQTPGDDGGMCLPSWNSSCANGKCTLTNPANGQELTNVDPDILSLCLLDEVCLCSTTTCGANLPGFGSTASFDLSLSGTAASGSVAGTFGDHNVHFTKDP